MMKNYMELLVDEVYNEVKDLYGDCYNERCSHNIKAKALNNLPTCYFQYNTPESDKKAFLLQRQRRISVLAKVAEAAKSVCNECKNK